MKKALIIIVSILVIVGLVLVGIQHYFINSPEYALMQIRDDVKKSGLEGLRPHLTDNAIEKLDSVVALTENKLLMLVVGLLSMTDYAGVLKSNIQDTKWKLKEIKKDDDQATVVLSFNYDDRLTGTIDFTMLDTKDGWKIDGLSMPDFEKTEL